mmetsp:Transcript_17727/g.40692  ORF Transcript_17727/g.40692 Transcript_17727/m.40692 type:complete len:249 (-) Transcript_17727:687-1433(-)
MIESVDRGHDVLLLRVVRCNSSNSCCFFGFVLLSPLVRPIDSNRPSQEALSVQCGPPFAGLRVPKLDKPDTLKVTRVLVVQPAHGLDLGVHIGEKLDDSLVVNVVRQVSDEQLEAVVGLDAHGLYAGSARLATRGVAVAVASPANDLFRWGPDVAVPGRGKIDLDGPPDQFRPRHGHRVRSRDGIVHFDKGGSVEFSGFLVRDPFDVGHLPRQERVQGGLVHGKRKVPEKETGDALRISLAGFVLVGR